MKRLNVGFYMIVFAILLMGSGAAPAVYAAAHCDCAFLKQQSSTFQVGISTYTAQKQSLAGKLGQLEQQYTDKQCPTVIQAGASVLVGCTELDTGIKAYQKQIDVVSQKLIGVQLQNKTNSQTLSGCSCG